MIQNGDVMTSLMSDPLLLGGEKRRREQGKREGKGAI